MMKRIKKEAHSQPITRNLRTLRKELQKNRAEGADEVFFL